MKIELGTWKGVVNLFAVPMDDLQVVLGLKFLYKVRALPMPFMSTVFIMEDNMLTLSRWF